MTSHYSMAIKQGTIYCITNKVNKKQYVGSTILPLNKRWKAHVNSSKAYPERELYSDMNKYGTGKFNVSVLEEVAEDKLGEREIYWIDKLNTLNEGYNQTKGGERPVMTDETKAKLSVTMKNKDRTIEWVNNIKETINNKVQSGEKWGFLCDEHRGDGAHMKQKIEGTNILTGEKKVWDGISDAALEVAGDKKKNGNIVLAAKNGWEAYGYTWRKIGDNLHKRKIYGIHKKTGEMSPIYESISSAERTINGKRGGGIRKSLLYPGRRTWKGYYWYYVTDTTKD